MRTRRNLTTAVTLAAAALTLTACSQTSGSDNAPAGTTPASGGPKPAAAAKVDCSDPNLSQADWTAHCDKQASNLHLQFGQTYTWPDGLKATVTQARVFTHYNKSLDEHATAGSTDFRLSIRITNGSHQPIDLSSLSTVTEGATNGGEASLGSWADQGSPLEGRMAPGVTAVKTDDGSLETKYGREIVVTLQRTGGDGITLVDSPEFTGSIAN